MPILGSRGAASAKAFGLTSGQKTVPTDYLVIAGGGGGGGQGQNGGGAGGFRTSYPGGTKIDLVYAQTYDITIGSGGNGKGPGYTGVNPNAGGDSTIAFGGDTTLASSGGGVGWSGTAPTPPNATIPIGVGGSGGGAHRGNRGGYSPAEGNPGGSSDPSQFSPNTNYISPGGPFGSGGGGHTNAGTGSPNTGGGSGGAGSTANITGSPFTASAGGGSGGWPQAGAGGSGGGGQGGGGPTTNATGNPGNTKGSGGGGGGGGPQSQYQTGGSGVGGRVVLRVPSDYTIAATPPSNTTSTDPGGDKIAIFDVTGTVTIS